MIRLILFFSVFACPLIAQVQHVAPTDALTPKEQRQKFQLPPGFEIQLVLSDPDIGQPMNLSFDVRGRLWVTSSVEYPFPAQVEGLEPRIERLPQTGDDSPSDWITIASDIGPDGRPGKVEHFAEGLNIPIGQTPVGEGEKGIIYSIPDISLYEDRNGDGLAEKSQVLYSHFGNIDTHGMANSFRWWIDGWIYGCHGFRNTSEIVDSQGNATELYSGHTYRFRPDGSRFEIYTRGQVNPFGLAIDPLGNVFSADCHSRPLFQLLQGGAYLRPSWGNPIDEPLGLAPEMIDHDHGSTGVCGPAYYAANHFPEDYRNNLFLCNPVTGRVHRDKLVQYGSTLIADTQPDFITCDDPWFRPVDATVGPDGALYIADFYNAIIGHYEVPLEHPKRDRIHGRVWRIVYKKPPEPAPDLTTLTTAQLIKTLEKDNEALRVLVSHQLENQWQDGNAEMFREAYDRASPNARAHLLWLLERGTGLADTEVENALTDASPVVKVHALKILAERNTWRDQERNWALRGLNAKDGFVQRAAADGMRRHPDSTFLSPLFDAWDKASAKDTHLIYVLRMAIREQLIHTEGWTTLKFPKDRLVEIAAATRTVEAARFVLLGSDPDKDAFQTALEANVQLLSQPEVEQVVHRLAEVRLDLERSIQLLGALIINLEPDPWPELSDWALKVIGRALDRQNSLERPILDLAIGLAGFLELEALSEPLLAMALEGDLTAIEAILEVDPENGFKALLDNLAIAPAAKQTALAQILCNSKEGAEKLLNAIEQGRASPSLLRDSVIRQRIGESNPRELALLENLPDASQEIAAVIAQRRAGYDSANRDFNQGKATFQMYCAVCHSIDRQGGKLGPNLDGVNVRGVDRLLEDILDPNRNVDPAFSLSTIRTRNGQNISGIGARLEEGDYVLTDPTGTTHRIPQDTVIEKTDSRLSMMPAVLGSQIPADDLYNLLEFLLGNRDLNSDRDLAYYMLRKLKRGSSKRMH
ncbi:MAG: hypothetical protein KJT03_01880 [Verrucomicrobiae bacterium]|nr:hypothetical protein [Verrucomicrobiae bacterium]